MAKIPNWSQHDDYEWHHDKKEAEVFIGLEGTGYRPVLVEFHEERGRQKRRSRDLGRSAFDTKTEARNYARKWMKNHPNL